LDEVINKIKQDPLTVEIKKEAEKLNKELEKDIDKLKKLSPTCEGYENMSESEEKSHRNFYQLMDTVYVHATDDAEEHEEDHSEEQADVFFWYDQIRESVYSDSAAYNIPSCSASEEVDQWKVEACLRYRDVLFDYQGGKFKFEDVKTCKLKQIENKKALSKDMKNDLKSDFASLQKVINKAEARAEKGLDKAIHKFEDVLKFP